MTALLDINIVLDVLLDRPEWVAESKAVWQAGEAGRFDDFISAASLPTIFYIARKLHGRLKAHQAIDFCLLAFEICPVDRNVAEAAMIFGGGGDFEDDLQIAAALRAGVSALITRDAEILRGNRIAAFTPAQWLARVQP